MIRTHAGISVTRRYAAGLLVMMLLCAPVHAARGVSPYLPLQQSPEIERLIERVMILAGEPVMSRPLAAATVLDALPAACEQDAAACAKVRRYLESFMGQRGVTHASASGRAGSNRAIALPNRRGMTSDSDYEVSVSAFWQPTDYLLVNGGMLAYSGEALPTGSVISLGQEYAQIDIGYRDHWLSPMTDSAMLKSTQARTMPSLTLSNYTPVTRLGLRYELFLARMNHSDDIRWADGFTAGRPLLAGIHLSLQPFSGWSIGFNRLMQYGGGARGGRSLDDVLRAFFRPTKYSNISTDGLTLDESFGNQVASVTSRLVMPGPVPFAVYFEYAGEDTSTSSDIRLGNVALSAGIHIPRLWDRYELVLEMSEWQNAWYVHDIYRDGLRYHGSVLGHWGGDWREPDEGVGARSLMLRVGQHAPDGGGFTATYRMLSNQGYTPTDYRRGHGVELRYSRAWRDLFVGAEVDAGRDVFGQRYSRLGAFVRF